MSDPRVHQNRVAVTGVVNSAVADDHIDILAIGQQLASPVSKFLIDLRHRDVSTAADNLGHDGGVVAGSPTEMEHAISFAKIQGVDPGDQRARSPVVKVSS